MDIWNSLSHRDVLKSVGINSGMRFCSVGGSSLLLLKLRKLIKNKFDIDIPFADLFEASILRGMAAKLGGPGPETGMARAKVIDCEHEAQLPPAIAVPSLSEFVPSQNRALGLVVIIDATASLAEAVLKQLLKGNTLTRAH